MDGIDYAVIALCLSSFALGFSISNTLNENEIAAKKALEKVLEKEESCADVLRDYMHSFEMLDDEEYKTLTERARAALERE